MLEYFPHDTNARNDEKILELRMELGAEGYGIYMMLIEKLASAKDNRLELNERKLNWDLHVENPATIRRVVLEFGLFDADSENGVTYFWSERVCNQAQQVAQVTSARSRAGRASVEAKARRTAEEHNGNTRSTSAEHMLNITATHVEHNGNTCSTDKTKQDKNREKENKTKEKSSSSKSEDAHGREEEAAEAAEEEEMDFDYDLWELDEKARFAMAEIELPQQTETQDIIKLRRWLTTPDDTDRRTLKMIMQTELKNGRQVCELLKIMQLADKQRPISPVDPEYLNAIAYVRRMRKPDQKQIRDAVGRKKMRWDELAYAVAECNGNDKIRQPSKFILSRIK